MGIPDSSFEDAARARGRRRIAGVDEAGRGPLAGPVVAAAVVLTPGHVPPGLDDSKRLSARRRAELFDTITVLAEVGVGIATVAEIDTLNILRAAHLAMERALAALSPPPDHCLIDGNLLPRGLMLPAEAIVRGDARALSIAAASIVAKVTRDRIMADLAAGHPGYGWEQNAGYGTRAHLDALERLGVSAHHRRSFRPVHNILCRVAPVTH